MPRRYRRRSYKITRPLKTTKYSNETYATLHKAAVATEELGTNVYAIQKASNIIPQTSVLGTRKVKNFTVRFKAFDIVASDNTVNPTVWQWALVFVPEGLTPTHLQLGLGGAFTSMYEPNQNVIISGVADSNQVYVSKTRLARNLNSGDGIYFVLTSENIPNGTYNVKYSVQINYAISF